MKNIKVEVIVMVSQCAGDREAKVIVKVIEKLTKRRCMNVIMKMRVS